jgi:hypothetical protein
MSHRSHYPRPEYPRPEKQRGLINGVDWLNLNGPWQFRFDGDRRGTDEKWFEGSTEPWNEQIIVPFCWESLAAWGEGNAANNENYYATRIFRNPLEVTRANHRNAERYEVGWYRREIEIPKNEHWENKRVILHIGAADYFTQCWCNGAHIGSNEGGYIPIEFDITDALKDGKGTLVLRVEDPMDNHEQPVGKQWKWYTTTSGIWQTVFLEPRTVAYIDHYRITTDISTGVVGFEIDCTNTPDGSKVHAEILAPDEKTVNAEFEVKDGKACGGVKMDPVILWDPSDPQLYRVILKLPDKTGNHTDVVRTYFGMRKISTAPVEREGAPAALCLNDKPIYLRGALYQSYYPDGVYTAGDAHVLRDDIAYAKKVGFDFLRIHIKLDDPLILYYADTMGILLMEDFPNFGEGGDTPLGRQRFERMMRKGIQRDFNHPAIVAWCLFNETWGFGGQVELIKHFGPNAHAVLAEKSETAKLENRSSMAWVQKMWELAKSLDGTRLVEDMSVVHWEHLHYFAHGDTDINSWHFYIHDYEKARKHIEGVVEQTYAGSKFNYEEGYQQGHQPLINSEYGGVGALDGDVDISWSFKYLTNELRRHGSLSAYIYTELHDVEWEYNGFLNYDRTAKDFGYDPKIINQGDVLPIDAPPIQCCAPGEKKVIEVSSSHYSRREMKGVTLFWQMSGVDSLGNIVQDLAVGSKPIPFRQYRVDLAHKIELTMPDTLMLCTLWVNAVAPDGNTIAQNFIQFFVTPGQHSHREELKNCIVLRCSTSGWSSSQWDSGICSQEEAESRGRCFGSDAGFFEWHLPVSGEELRRAKRLKLLCEASAYRPDMQQTDPTRFPTTFEVLLNGVVVHHAVLPNHPHDTRGALSYLKGGRGGYGYLAHALAEGELLDKIRQAGNDGSLVLRCAVPESAHVKGGLTVYGGEAGRYPIPPTVIVDF